MLHLSCMMSDTGIKIKFSKSIPTDYFACRCVSILFLGVDKFHLHVRGGGVAEYATIVVGMQNTSCLGYREMFSQCERYAS